MQTFRVCLVLIGVCLAMSNSQAVPTSQSLVAGTREEYTPLKRVVRQDIPQPPEMPSPPEDFPPPPGMRSNDYRKKREARGVGGALPTRRG